MPPTFFTSIPEVPSKTYTIVNRHIISHRNHVKVPGRQLDRLANHISIFRAITSETPAATLTSSFQNLTRALSAIGKSECHDLIVSREFDLFCCQPASSKPVRFGRWRPRTLSRMTRGPLTPPTVLYRILGMTEYDEDSRGSAMMGDGSVVGRLK